MHSILEIPGSNPSWNSPFWWGLLLFICLFGHIVSGYNLFLSFLIRFIDNEDGTISSSIDVVLDQINNHPNNQSVNRSLNVSHASKYLLIK
jgi:hypothetical protein